MNIVHYLQEKKEIIEKELYQIFAEKKIPQSLQESMLYSLQAGGKRLRPILVLAVLEACGKPLEIGLEAACALEVVHTYSLIHDDLPCMDDDDFRRGKPTNHKVFGEATAVLAGDGLLTVSFELIAASPHYTADQKVALLALLAKAAGAEGMVGGQMADMESEDQQLTLTELQRVHERKTGKLLEAAVSFGAILGGVSNEAFDHLQRYSYHLGIAFQIQDDILDVQGDSQVMGKQVGSDEHNNKSTYPKLLTLQGAKDQLMGHLAQAKTHLTQAGIQTELLASIADYVVQRNH
ncbi:geranylgeranyl pyrophosphate synthase [Fictibacillus macauensis ZFHKF-1]|uniref:Farnesyl diphosphate synthase n=1 Tax=Fictibacillus macauensis ZFHKF-1 TaxID=1196324 RepID=I8UKH1_9BACL|nr:farnesyl diphosphate synthase [Fictibacillus macauensis]EIT87323.1 geranylgeranyl pyrophosphate synthase [Fictibacillus macauensis ZFHKF-1]